MTKFEKFLACLDGAIDQDWLFVLEYEADNALHIDVFFCSGWRFAVLACDSDGQFTFETIEALKRRPVKELRDIARILNAFAEVCE